MLTYAAFYLGLATLFLLGTRKLVHLTYGDDRPDKPENRPEERDDLA
ncbi:hypothetical protein P12x_002603 [Tundrisphaera lichenicola]